MNEEEASLSEMNDAQPHETPHCSFTFHAPRILVQRFKPSMRFEQDALDELARTRDLIIGDALLCALLVVIPSDVPVKPEATNVDHFTSERERRRILALALIAEGDLMRSVSKFYFTWFPQAFPCVVLDTEPEGIRWLEDQIRSSP